MPTVSWSKSGRFLGGGEVDIAGIARHRLGRAERGRRLGKVALSGRQEPRPSPSQTLSAHGPRARGSFFYGECAETKVVMESGQPRYLARHNVRHVWTGVAVGFAQAPAAFFYWVGTMAYLDSLTTAQPGDVREVRSGHCARGFQDRRGGRRRAGLAGRSGPGNYAPDQWPAFLDGACLEQPELRRWIEMLLEAHRETGTGQRQVPGDVPVETWQTCGYRRERTPLQTFPSLSSPQRDTMR